jgi:hypothetical protein
MMAMAWLLQACLVLGMMWVSRRTMRAIAVAEDRIWFASGGAAATARIALKTVPVCTAAVIVGIALATLGVSSLAGTVVSIAILAMFASVCALGLTLPNIKDPFRAERPVPQ